MRSGSGAGDGVDVVAAPMAPEVAVLQRLDGRVAGIGPAGRRDGILEVDDDLVCVEIAHPPQRPGAAGRDAQTATQRDFHSSSVDRSVGMT